MIAALFLIATQAQKPEGNYMGPARYYAGSNLPDPQAAGGYGTSDRLPVRITDRALLGNSARPVLSRTGSVFTLWVVNGGTQPTWFRAADSNILGWLEARDASGKWKPIEFHQWYSCGNSYPDWGFPRATAGASRSPFQADRSQPESDGVWPIPNESILFQTKCRHPSPFSVSHSAPPLGRSMPFRPSGLFQH